MNRVSAAFAVLIPILLLTGGCPEETTSTTTGGGTSTGGSSSGGTSTGDSSTGGTTTTDEDRILELVNSERTSRGLTAFTRNTLLDAAAVTHAADMRNGGFFAHTGSDGSSVSVRATTAGYVWTAIGENIGQGDISAEAMMDLWMNSDGHRANILNTSFTELGVGIDTSGSTLWVQVFGKP